MTEQHPTVGEIVSIQTNCAHCGKVAVDTPFDLCPVCAERERLADRDRRVDDAQRRLFA